MNSSRSTGLLVVRGFARGHQPGPRHVIPDRLAFGYRKFRGQRLVGQQSEHGLFVRQFRAEAVHHANRAVAIGLHQRMRQVEADQKLLHAQPAIDQVDFEVALAQDAVAIFQLLGRDDLDGVAFFAEKIAEKLVLALAGAVRRAKLHDRDVRLLGPAELLIRFQQRLQ